MISPSWRDVSPAEQLHRIPRLVPPRFGLETVALRPKSFLLIFLGQKAPCIRTWASRAYQVAHEAGGLAPTLVDGGWPSSGAFFARYFLYIPKLTFVEFQGFLSCAE